MAIESELITVPHPRLHLRNFVLVPMAEIAPHFIHPKLNQTMQELLENSPDSSKFIRWKPIQKDQNLAFNG
jgi:7,8-dihydro-6-hydroxymethylpterin-pyrophosphokinase